MEQRHRLDRAHALRQTAERERHQAPAEAVPHQMHPHLRRHRREPPDHRTEPPLADRARASLHRVVRRLPQQLPRTLPRVRQHELPRRASGLGRREPVQRLRELPAHLGRAADGEHPGLALRHPLRQCVRAEQRLRAGRHHLHQRPHQPPELLQLRFLRRVLVQHPGDLVDHRGVAGEGVEKRVPGVGVERGRRHRPGRGRRGPREVRNRLVRKLHGWPDDAHVPDPRPRCEAWNRREETAVEPGRAGALVVPPVREDDQVSHPALAHLAQQPVAFSLVDVSVGVEGQLPVRAHTHRRIRHDRPPCSPKWCDVGASSRYR